MRPSKLLKFITFAACFTIASCSTDPNTGNVSTSSTKGSQRFEHRLEKLPDGKTKLTLIPASSFAKDAISIEREAQIFAESFAISACPKGYDFYASGPLGSRKSELTYVFQCKG